MSALDEYLDGSVDNDDVFPCKGCGDVGCLLLIRTELAQLTVAMLRSWKKEKPMSSVRHRNNCTVRK